MNKPHTFEVKATKFHHFIKKYGFLNRKNHADSEQTFAIDVVEFFSPAVSDSFRLSLHLLKI